MRLSRVMIAVSAAMLVATLPARAATETDYVTFSATSFTGGPPPLYTGGTAPVDPVTGAFTITFDPTQTYTDSTTGITLNSLNISLDSALSFNYSPNAYTADGGSWAAGELVVGGISEGAAVVALESGNADFYLQVLTFTSTPTYNQLGYVTEDGSYFYGTVSPTDGSITVTPVAPTPLPAALPLFGTGLGAMGVLGWRRKRKNAAALAVA